MRPQVTGTRGGVGARGDAAAGAGLATDPAALRDELARRVVGPAWEEVDRAVRAVWASARSAWPVLTGRSREQLSVTALRAGDAPTWAIRDPLPYVGHIRERGQTGRTVDRLVRDPLGPALAGATRAAARKIGGGS